MKRGEIYYAFRDEAPTGAEMWAAGRPAVIVSNDCLAETSGVQQVAFLTTQPKKEMPTHVSVLSTGRPSTAICEQITSVSVSRLGEKCGECTAEEMHAIDRALRTSLGIADPPEIDANPRSVHDAMGAATEAQIYKQLYNELLERMLSMTKGGASR